MAKPPPNIAPSNLHNTTYLIKWNTAKMAARIAQLAGPFPDKTGHHPPKHSPYADAMRWLIDICVDFDCNNNGSRPMNLRQVPPSINANCIPDECDLMISLTTTDSTFEEGGQPSSTPALRNDGPSTPTVRLMSVSPPQSGFINATSLDLNWQNTTGGLPRFRSGIAAQNGQQDFTIEAWVARSPAIPATTTNVSTCAKEDSSSNDLGIDYAIWSNGQSTICQELRQSRQLHWP